MRDVSTRVFPLPGPAVTRMGFDNGAVTAFRCSLLRPLRYSCISGEVVTPILLLTVFSLCVAEDVIMR